MSGNVVATDAAGMEEVRRRGMILWDKLTTCRDLTPEGERLLHLEFMRLPSRKDYADYYEMIKKPISFLEIKHKLDKLEYTSLAEVRLDFNQVFVNAKRYNAPGSSIFLDAKRLHKLLKDTYGVITGEIVPPDEEEAPAASAAPSASSAPAAIPGTTFAKRGPTLKPWLTKKLAETMDHFDSAGRSYSDNFKTLPDRKAWPEYYKVITHPMCFDMIAAKVIKRYYTSVQQFVDDVNVVFANALFFNEETSRIWKDAKVMQLHFNEVMQEVPPVFVPPRKYNTAKRRAEQEAIAAGLPPPSGKKQRQRREQGESEPPEDGYEDGAGDTGDEEYEGGSYPPTSYSQQGGSTPFELPFAPMEDVEYGAARSGSETPGMSPSFAFAGLPQLPPPFAYPQAGAITLPPLPTPVSVPALYQQPIAPYQTHYLPAYPIAPAAPIPTSPSNGIGSPSVVPSSSTEAPKPRLVARLPAKGDLPSISRFLVRMIPSTLPLTLDNSLVRQHSFAIPSTTSRVDFTPFFRRVAPSPNKGKGKSQAVEGPLQNPVVKTSVRPAGTPFESVDELPRPEGPTTKYSLVPGKGLTVVEFLVAPKAGTAVGDGATEVYRVFVSKP